jgi:phospholipase C
MSMRRLVSRSSRKLRTGLAFLAAFNYIFAGPLVSASQATPINSTTSTLFKPAIAPINYPTSTPIKHAIVIIGENRTFDHIFATYKPKPGQSVDNLLSKHIINPDGTPGPNYSFAVQYSACDPGTGVNCQQATTGLYEISPQSKSLYPVLPAPLVGGPSNVCVKNPAGGPGICTLAQATSSENGLAQEYYYYMLTGGTGQKSGRPDQRIPNVNKLPPGPFQLSSMTFPYDAYANSPVHRFYQMWQDLDCNTDYALFFNPAGCSADLFAWVEVTVGAGANGLKQPPNFSTEWSPTAVTTGEGSTSMGFYNVQRGDAPYLKLLADTYSMSDNYHQPVLGGTGANHIMMGTGDAIFFSDSTGKPAVPPHNQLVWKGTPNAGVVDEIENPNPAPKTNNWYTEDGYGGGAFGSPSYGGGSYTNCSDVT